MGNQGGNNNDRLPGGSLDSLPGPDYATTDLRVTRRLFAGDRMKVELLAESFNLLKPRQQVCPDHAGWFHQRLDPVCAND
jgi:hypothetical protein